ncbi:hypothetical protein [Saccharopolyspora sp. NPDC049357]|uniref:hypothetical protein n=1 Tax=Saccharopolyspora sp. NPDC049357 TaxID=3154507 RepID=UPI003440B53D
MDGIARVDLPGIEVQSDPLRVRALIRALARNTSTEVSAAKLSAEAEIGEFGAEVFGPDRAALPRCVDPVVPDRGTTGLGASPEVEGQVAHSP